MRPASNSGPRQRAWGPGFYADVVLSQFVRFSSSSGGVPDWISLAIDDFEVAAAKAINHATAHWAPTLKKVGSQTLPLDPTNTAHQHLALRWELRELAALVEARPGAIAEIVAQKDTVLQYFRGILGFTMRSHPATTYLAIVASRIAGFAAMRFKNQFNRMRPSSVLPVLLPPLEVPGHAAYPSGHATQANLVAMCLEVVMPQGRVMPPASSQFRPQYGPLRMMADRIARNREVAGLHYRSDTWAGRILASRCFGIMLNIS